MQHNVFDIFFHRMLGCSKERGKIAKEKQKALKELNRDKIIIVLPADKGKATVGLDSRDYVDKAETHLGGAATCILLDRNPLPSTMNGSP